MGTTTETIVIEVDAVRAANNLARLEDRMASMGASASRAGQQSSAGLRPMAEALAQVNRVSQASSGSLAAVAESMGALARGSGTSSARLLAFATAGTAAVGVAAALAAAAVKTAADVDDLSDSLSYGDRQALAPYIARLRDANAAMEDAGDATTRLQIKFGAFFADVVEGGAKATEVVVGLLEKLFEVDDENTKFARLSKQIADSAPKGLVDQLGRPLVSATQAQIDEIERQNAAAKAARAAAASRPMRDRGPSSPNRAEDDFAGAAFNVADLWMQGQQQDADAEKAALEDRERTAREFAERVDKLREDYHRREIDRINEAKDRDAKAAAERLAVAQELTGGLYNVFGAFADFQMALVDETAKTNKEAARAQFEDAKSVMYAQAIAGAALAIIQGFAQLGPIGGALATVTTAVATGAQIMRIQNAEPSFHVGGTYAPDERVSLARTRDNELGAFFTSQAVDALGGRQAAQDLAQTGRVRNREQDIYLILDGEQFKARRFARPDPRMGHRSR